MLASLICFVLTFFVQTLILGGLYVRFKKLKEKHRRKTITDAEKWERALISVPAKPFLEVILDKNPVGIRVIITISVLISTITTVFLTSNDALVIIVSIVLVFSIWLSLKITE